MRRDTRIPSARHLRWQTKPKRRLRLNVLESVLHVEPTLAQRVQQRSAMCAGYAAHEQTIHRHRGGVTRRPQRRLHGADD